VSIRVPPSVVTGIIVMSSVIMSSVIMSIVAEGAVAHALPGLHPCWEDQPDNVVRVCQQQLVKGRGANHVIRW